MKIGTHLSAGQIFLIFFPACGLTASPSPVLSGWQIFLLLFLLHLAVVGWVAFTYGVDALQVSRYTFISYRKKG